MMSTDFRPLTLEEQFFGADIPLNSQSNSKIKISKSNIVKGASDSSPQLSNKQLHKLSTFSKVSELIMNYKWPIGCILVVLGVGSYIWYNTNKKKALGKIEIKQPVPITDVTKNDNPSENMTTATDISENQNINKQLQEPDLSPSSNFSWTNNQ